MAGNENANHPDEKKSLKSDFDDTIDDQCNSSTAKFMNGKNGGEACVEFPEDSNSEVSFSGLGKEELMKFADDPFWVRVRIILFAFFWIGWILMLVAAVVIIVLAPRCPERPNLKWYETDVVYKIDPKSFKDTSNKDATVGKGIGDLKGTDDIYVLDSWITFMFWLVCNTRPIPYQHQTWLPSPEVCRISLNRSDRITLLTTSD